MLQANNHKIKVLVVDDSAVVRQSLSRILGSDPAIEVIGVASDPYVAVQKIGKQVPDVITLDIEMPKMDGLTFLKRIMGQHPIPVVIISSLTAKGSDLAIKALELGAVDIIQKNALSIDNFSNEAQQITEIVNAAGKSVIRRKVFKESHAARIETLSKEQPITTSSKIMAIGASTGGTEAIKSVLEEMPIDCPGIIVVQHMPEMFTRSFAERMNNICKIHVKEASDGDSVLRGQALIAPGNFHMEVRRSGAKYFVKLNQKERVNRHRPSVDVLFHSLAKYAGQNSVGMILTGMGSDGAKGLLAMKESGAQTFAQDERSCVVYGMPKESVRLGAVQKTTPLNLLPERALHSINYALA
ncbi:MAG: chemotaxis response regulator protein-glutamate methylesterase [Bacteroidota bacterium]